MTTGNSRPFALCSVISQIRASRDPCSSSTSDSSDRRSTKPPSDGSGSRLSYSRAADTSSARFSMRAFGVFAALVAQVLQVAAPVEHLADRDRHRVLPRDLGQADDQIAKHRERRGGAPGERAILQAAHDPRPERVGRQRGLKAGRQQREVVERQARPSRSTPSRPCRCRAPAR